MAEGDSKGFLFLMRRLLLAFLSFFFPSSAFSPVCALTCAYIIIGVAQSLALQPAPSLQSE